MRLFNRPSGLLLDRKKKINFEECELGFKESIRSPLLCDR